MRATGKGITARERKKHELRAFALLAIVLAPLLSVVVVGGLGLTIWIFQMVAGPPGPPAG